MSADDPRAATPASTSRSAEHGEFLSVLSALRMVESAYSDIAKRLCAELGVGGNDVRAVELLIEDPGLSPTDLAKRLDISPPSATALVDRLVEAGFVERIPDIADRRRRLLVVTEAGTHAMFRSLEPLLDELSQIGTELDANEQRTISEFLQRVAASYRSFSTPTIETNTD